MFLRLHVKKVYNMSCVLLEVYFYYSNQCNKRNVRHCKEGQLTPFGVCNFFVKIEAKKSLIF